MSKCASGTIKMVPLTIITSAFFLHCGHLTLSSVEDLMLTS